LRIDSRAPRDLKVFLLHNGMAAKVRSRKEEVF
jgi:hypothetical protein